MDHLHGFTKYEDARMRITLFLEQLKTIECVKYLKEYICPLLDFIGVEYVKFDDKYSHCIKLLLIDGSKLSLSVPPSINPYCQYPNIKFETLFEIDEELDSIPKVYFNIHEFSEYLSEHINEFKLIH
jgi:hypothetical protein